MGNPSISQYIFDQLNKEFNFNLDVCATDDNHKCDNYYTEESNGLDQDWKGTCWMNPPYDNCAGWIEKAYIESLRGSTVVALIPSRTDTKYFNEYIMNADEIRFIKGRLKFGNSKNSAPFPSMIVKFSNHNKSVPSIKMYREEEITQPINPIYHMIEPIRFINEV